MRIGALEAGGTKMVCAAGDEAGNIYKRIVIPTKTPDKTIPSIISFFQEERVEALGIGCFGPLNLSRDSLGFGRITSTPKLPWQQYAIVDAFQKGLGVPVFIDTDVNAAALGEAVYGAGQGKEVVVYITIGTGIGVGVCWDYKLLHGLVHPEAGHILISKRSDDKYEGACPFHKNCFEGLASGPSILGRWGRKAEELGGSSAVWELEADYIAQAITNYILAYSPDCIILGGGVMHQKELYPLIQEKVKEYLNGYITHAVLEQMEEYIVPPALGDDSGIKGALQLAIARL